MSKRILVTGANGMLGQDLCPMLEDEGYDVIETDVHNMDITDINVVKQVLDVESPDIVINCAAYTNADKAEEDFDTAKKINVTGTENLAKICGERDITLIYISTDYVFNGEKNEPYEPSDKPDPLNNYGITKYLGEEAVKKYCSKYYIVRTSWLYGIHGKNFVDTMLFLAENQELIKVVDDQVGSPTWTIELANGIISLINDKPYGIYHICGSGSTSWYGLAKEVFKLAGLEVNLTPCTTEGFPRPAKRPKYSVMNNDKMCRDWKLALKDYIKLRIGE